jgi:TetR/AcrR family transcriptional regulator, transcriptional repressor for nem operon
MRRSRKETANTRNQIVSAAAHLFRERGIASVGPKAIMDSLGMTHGGFYKHFASKEALVSEAISAAAASSPLHQVDDTSPDAFRQGIEVYLSAGHVEATASGCPVAALAPDSTRQAPEVRQTMVEAIEELIDWTETHLPDGGQTRASAVDVVASMVGALVLARAAKGTSLSKEALDVVRTRLLAEYAPANAPHSSSKEHQ